ncbi:MAG: alpha-ketoglutarate-dependent dioxygenase AlkB, partial [Planctomycetales bacterium]
MAQANNRRERLDLDDECYVEYQESFFDASESERLLECFSREDFPWERQRIRGVLTRRANAWFANDPRFVYQYSGQTWTPHPFREEITEIRDRLEEILEIRFNSALAALYPDGRAAVAWHDDDDFPSFPDAPIATVSFGSERRFKIRR